MTTKKINKTKEEPLEIVRGSGNIFRDFNLPNPDLQQLKCILVARILRVLDDEKLTVRKAEKLTGFAAADFSRLRSVDIGRFTTDRLITMLYRLGQEVEVSVKVTPRPAYKISQRPAYAHTADLHA